MRLHHNIEISIRTLKRRLRKICSITEDSLKQIISREIEGSAATKGYRPLWSSIKVSYRVNIKRDVVNEIAQRTEPKWKRKPKSTSSKTKVIRISGTKLLLARRRV